MTESSRRTWSVKILAGNSCPCSRLVIKQRRDFVTTRTRPGAKCDENRETSIPEIGTWASNARVEAIALDGGEFSEGYLTRRGVVGGGA